MYCGGRFNTRFYRVIFRCRRRTDKCSICRFIFSMTVKEAAIYSVGTIFFSQLSKLITLGVTHTVPKCSILTLAVAVICAVAGGILGAKMNKKATKKLLKQFLQ